MPTMMSIARRAERLMPRLYRRFVIGQSTKCPRLGRTQRNRIHTTLWRLITGKGEYNESACLLRGQVKGTFCFSGRTKTRNVECPLFICDESTRGADPAAVSFDAVRQASHKCPLNNPPASMPPLSPYTPPSAPRLKPRAEQNCLRRGPDRPDALYCLTSAYRMGRRRPVRRLDRWESDW